MEVCFQEERLAKLCSTERNLVRKFGPEAAKRIQVRLTQMSAATCLEDFRHLPGRCHELTADRKGELSLDLHGPYRLIFSPTVQPPPRKEDGGLDWSGVEAVTVHEITDTHDS